MDEIRKIAHEVGQLLYSNPKEALRLAERAADMAEASGAPFGVGIALLAKGAALSRCNENLAAVECFDRALKIFEEAGDPLETTKTRMNRINAYLLLSRFDEALADSERPSHGDSVSVCGSPLRGSSDPLLNRHG